MVSGVVVELLYIYDGHKRKDRASSQYTIFI